MQERGQGQVCCGKNGAEGWPVWLGRVVGLGVVGLGGGFGLLGFGFGGHVMLMLYG